ncbi:DNA-binding transcriptional regulator, MerR family [Evansella caseinilytica]|uniref:DNA-binding transcriptional regulator, MerR family n=1 Tax=Evansella caseinilytica TaxID=1503961 RepID=A0A1H3HX39_9BACI|nr:MerR family transcriptional regulator [Evansella caseinilytica]SDY19334.1 DNA-binding transcriptional regulator, MerR family [Evansella caseinilytica]
MKDYWKVGELAALTGLTIRTLRYYDQIELFSPSQHTQSGHRLYTKSDLSKLQEILALKHIGISLDEIKTIITNREDDFSVSIIEAQISRIKKDIDIQQNLLHKLESALITIRNKKVMSVEELTKLLEAMKMYQEKYFTKEQLDRMKSHYDAFDQDTLKEKEQEFKTILEKIQIAKNNGVPPNDSKVQALAKTWSNIVYSFSKQDQDLQKQMESFHAQNPENSLRFGMDSEIYKYIKEALK